LSSGIQLVTQTLQQRGFAFAYSTTGYAFEGAVPICGKLVRIRVTLEDDTFVDLPGIQLLERPDGMPSIVPHVSQDGVVCYAAHGTLVFNIFDPAGQVLACVERAIDVVESAIRGDLAADLAEEFFAYWPGELVFADMPLTKACNGKAFFCKHASSGSQFVFLTDDVERTKKKLSDSVFNAQQHAVDVQVVKSKSSPGVRQTSWPPRTVGEFLSWQGELDSDCSRRIVRSLENVMKSGRRYVAVLIQSPTSWYGILAELDQKEQSGDLMHRLNVRPALLKSKIFPLSVMRIDDDYLASRNVPERKTLLGLRIALVGCGTIGGYLADLLVRAGAGLKGGLLSLIDSESFMPGNMGRHRLGLPSMFKFKASELADELKRVVPSACVEACVEDVRKVTNLADFDLVIDATGEEALSNFLNKTMRQDRFVPMVFSWVAGAGESVHVLIRDTPEVACYHCMSTHQVVSGTVVPPTYAGFGCESLYVPFPVSVSVSAAALALDAVLDWANGQSSPKFRSRVMKGTLPGTQDHDLEKIDGCPACAS